MPLANFGGFVCEVPAPLAIGTVELDDGTWTKGFVCEPLALEGATDITHFGGWRAYIASRA
jgi:allophanate hydrolase